MAKKRTLEDVNGEDPQMATLPSSRTKKSKTTEAESKSNKHLKNEDGSKKVKDKSAEKKAERKAEKKRRKLEARMAAESEANSTKHNIASVDELAKREEDEQDVVPPMESPPAENGEPPKENKKKKKKDKASKKQDDPSRQEAVAQPEAISTEPTPSESRNEIKQKKKKKNKGKSAEVAESQDTQEAVPLQSEPASEPTGDEQNEQPQTNRNHRFICFIGNLPFSATKESIAEHFKSVSPLSIRAPTKKDSTTNTSRGFAFLEFDRYDRMKTCLQLYHHSKFDDGKSPPRRINVELTYVLTLSSDCSCFSGDKSNLVLTTNKQCWRRWHWRG